MIKLSTYQKGKILYTILEELKTLTESDLCCNIYVRDDSDKIVLKLAKKAKIPCVSYGPEAGSIDISEYIIISYDYQEDRLIKRLNGFNPSPLSNRRYMPNFEVNEELKKLTEQFEKDNIPQTGPCTTLIGEMFRAMQRIQYRAYNDGDLCWEIGSPSFVSYLFLISQIDKLNYSSFSYNQETGYYKFQFTDPYLIEYSYDGHISSMIESPLGDEVAFIKYQLIDLLSNGKIKDEKNSYDSRSYSCINK